MKDKAIFRSYLKNLHKIMGQGDAREESFYSALEALIDAYANASDNRDIYVTTLPKKTEAGYPDFRVWEGEQHIVGYIEAKPPSEGNLQLVSETDQLKRYRHTFPNLILTNFFEFRLYRDGDLVETVQIARPLISTKLGKVPPLEKADKFVELLEKFFAFSLPKSYSAESLAMELAKRTRFLRDEVVRQQLAQEKERGAGDLLGFYEAFQTYLIGGLTEEDFADLYSQTITYGLFAARVRVGDGFNRRAAFDAIPHTIGILRDLFRFISLGDLPTALECNVDDIAEVLAIADVQGILHRYFHSGGAVEKLTTPPKGKGADPIVHFYETFLKYYDPAARERRGVYYTPEPVVSYIVRSLHAILKDKKKFDKPDGLASEGVTLLDPAAGTMTFVAKAAQVAVDEFVGKYGEGSRESFIRDHILRNFYAFELMMAPYAVGHLKMAFFLEELGYQLTPEERCKFYLTNTLEMEELAEAKLPGLSSLAKESHKAGKVKKDTPILVILGNPPYSGHSANKGPWIRGLIEDYKKVDDKPLGERNPKWLQDDYVKFIRFAEWKIAQSGEGMVGMITNHSYLDNPTFRGMRQHLMNTFDEIYVLNLHGNTLKKERCPDGSKDENVFDIRQGVAIAFFIKRSVGARPRRSAPRVFHAERFGVREAKYEWLEANDWRTTDWQKLRPRSEFYLYVSRDEEALEHYDKFVKVTDIFPVNNVGIVTSRDRFVFDFDKKTLERRIRTFLDPSLPDELVRESFKLKDTHSWNMAEKRKLVQQDETWEKKIIPCLYRPFDVRWMFYHHDAIDRGREEVMRHMLVGGNTALVVPRRVEHVGSWQHAFATKHASEHVAVSLKTIDYYFPLYLYLGTDPEDLFNDQDPGDRQLNLNPGLSAALSGAFGEEPAPEDIFHYLYAVLYAPSYREKYAEFLRIDFPRIPFTKDVDLFQKLAALGERLVDLHLLRSSELDPPIARFQGEGDTKVQTGKKGLRYDAETQRVHINEEQFFEGVSPQVWEYPIGGYQVCHKWLKDRKERRLTLEEIKTYCRIATALEKTIQIQAEIDTLYPQVEKTLLPIHLESE